WRVPQPLEQRLGLVQVRLHPALLVQPRGADHELAERLQRVQVDRVPEDRLAGPAPPGQQPGGLTCPARRADPEPRHHKRGARAAAGVGRESGGMGVPAAEPWTPWPSSASAPASTLGARPERADSISRASSTAPMPTRAGTASRAGPPYGCPATHRYSSAARL